MTRLLQDIRFSLRQLRKAPGFALIVLATLGLCVGANTAIFSVLDAVLLRPAPYPSPERLALLTTVTRHEGAEYVNDSQTGALFEAVRDGAPQLDLAAWSGHGGVNFASAGHSEFVDQQRVSTGYFRVLGVLPQYGREFTPAEDASGGAPVAILSYNFWRRVFHGDPAALGRPVNLRGEPYTVIGVMPREFRATAAIDVWTPLRPSRTGEGSGSNYCVVARLKPGVTWAAAQAQLQALSRSLMEAPGFPREYRNFEERIVPLQRGLTADSRTQLLIAWAAVLMVLVIGCVNVAGLMLARASARHREIATRLALGGGRAAIVRQLLTESLLLALGGCALGVALGYRGIAWLKDLGAGRLEMWHPIRIDARVLLAMLALSAGTSILFGLAPALETSRLDLRTVLVEGGRGVVGGRRRWARQALVACEVALCLVLLVCAGLLVRTLGYLDGLNPGFDTRNVISAQISLQDARYRTSLAVNRLYGLALDRMRRIPGVESAAVALTLPYQRPLNDGFRALDGDDAAVHGIEAIYVTPGYFETLRIPIRRGRGFQDSDTPAGAPVAVVSESFARKYYARHEPLGGHLKMGKESLRIVGIVGDVEQHSGLGNFGPLSVQPTIYVPVAQLSDAYLQLIHTWFSPSFAIRAAGAVGVVEAQVQAAVAAADPQLPIARFKTIADLRGDITLDQRYHAMLFSTIAGLALLLAALGLYGLISHSVNQRTHELGVRMALGATAGQAIATAVKPGLVLALAGIGAGYALSRLAVRFLEHMLFGVRSTDPATFAVTAGILLAATAAASLIPAVRILWIDPARTLRDE
ncbi:MAG: ABC transporter permease [Bryobacteraceae bacterium]